MSLQTLYEKDFYSWVNQSILLLKAHKLEKLDVVNLIEELEGMASKDRRELISRLMQLLCRFLKWDYQESKRSNSWVNTIAEQQVKVALLLEDSPSLKKDVDLKKAYTGAVKLAMAQTNLPKSAFPTECPYEFREIMNKTFKLKH